MPSSRGVLSSLFECVDAHADLRTRRTAPFPTQVAAQLDAVIAAHRALTWPARRLGGHGPQRTLQHLREALVLTSSS
jgi:acyl-CoA thioester hydrolase